MIASFIIILLNLSEPRCRYLSKQQILLLFLDPVCQNMGSPARGYGNTHYLKVNHRQFLRAKRQLQ